MVDDLSAKWKAFSVILGLKITALDTIQENYPRDVQGCFLEALREWLKLNYDYGKQGKPSWRKLAEAARRLGFCDLFNIIVKKHSSF